MRRILADTVAFGKQYMRSRVGAFFTFIFPILLILLFGAVFAQTGTQALDLPVQDLDGSTLSRSFLAALNNTTVVTVSMIPSDADLQTHVKANSLAVALQVPADFERDVLASLMTNGTAMVNVTIYGDVSRSSFGVVMGVVRAVAEQMNFALANARPIVGVGMTPVASPSFQVIDFFLPGVLGLTVMTTSLYATSSLSAEYRTRRYFKILATTTLTKAEWLAAKVLWFAISLLASVLITILVGIAAWNVRVTLDPVSIAIILFGVLLFASMGMVLGSISKDAESASAIANAIGFPMMFLSGSFWQIEAMPSYLQTVARVLPLTYMNNGLRDAMVYGNLDGALFNLAVVAVLSVVFFGLAAKLVSWKER